MGKKLDSKKILTISGLLIITLSLSVLFFRHVTYNVNILWELTLNDPLFYSPGINIDLLETNINKLQQVDTEFKITANSLRGSSATTTLDKFSELNLIPIDYLRLLPKSIQRTDDFLNKPTLFHAVLMLIADYQTAKAYENNSELFYNIVSNLKPIRIGEVVDIHFFASKTNTDIYFRDIFLIRENGKKLVGVAKNRISCLGLGLCKIDKVIVTDKLPRSNYVETSYLRNDIPDKQLSGKLSIKHRSGPYFVETDCFPTRPVPLYLYHDPDRGFVPKQSNENYYINLRTLKTELLEEGYNVLDDILDFEDINEGSSYRCTNLEYWSDLATIHYFNTYIDEDIKSSMDLEVYTQRLESKLKGTEKNFEEQLVLLIAKNKLVDLPYVIDSISYNLNSYRNIIENTKNLSPTYAVIARSSYSLTFSTFSDSIWRLNESPQFVSAENLDLLPSNTTYSAIKSKYTPEEINAFHSFKREPLFQRGGSRE